MFGKNIKTITVQELKVLNKKKPLIIDVRESHEYETMHIPNSINVPRKMLLNAPEEFITGTAYLVCASGSRSKKVTKKLSKKFDVFNVIGGTNSYGGKFALVRTQKIELEKKKTKKK